MGYWFVIFSLEYFLKYSGVFGIDCSGNLNFIPLCLYSNHNSHQLVHFFNFFEFSTYYEHNF